MVVDEALDLLKLDGDGVRISVVDVTLINKTRNRHHFFTDSSEFYDDLYQRLLLEPPVLSRQLYPVSYDENSIYWIMREK